MIIEFTVPGIPIAQPRPRATVQRYGKKYYASLYTPQDADIKEYKHAVLTCATTAYPMAATAGPFLCPIAIDMVFVMPRPKKYIWLTKPMPRIPCRDVPDFDNLEKGVCDALTKIIWRDDRQIWDSRTRKVYAAGDEQPHTRILISTVDGELDHLETDERKPECPS
jgi:Holliday junction resolvase RusA-like endonuclease